MGEGEGKTEKTPPHPLPYPSSCLHPVGGTFFLTSLPLPEKLKMVAELFTM